MEKTKVTAKDFYAAIKGAIEGMEKVGDYDTADVVAFIDKKVEQIDAKAAKARERASAKKADGDAIRAKVEATLTDEFQTADAITAAIGDEDISKSKVVARLTQLVDAGIAIKEQAKVGDAKRMTYKLAGAVEEAADTDAE